MFTVRHAWTQKGGKPLLIIFLYLLLFDSTLAIKWLGVYRERNIPWNQTKTCRTMKTLLNGEQTKICRNYSDAMPYVQEAATLSISTCQNFFRYHRWNCSTLKNVPRLLPDLSLSTKERAFVHALSAAALAYTIARGCASSAIKSCSCASHPDEPPDGNFKWGGCGDNVNYGAFFSDEFIDSRKKPAPKLGRKSRRQLARVQETTTNSNRAKNNGHFQYSLRKWIRNHNGNYGRTIVSESLVKHCKCHGVSGSCTVQTCWRGLPVKFREIGEKLVAAYTAAIQIHPQTTPDILINRFSDSQSLLFSAPSPDYCEYNPSRGSFGVRGRECNNSVNALENCDSMCCGRGYKSYTIEEQSERCNCKYISCCYYVSCETCKIKRQALICN